MSAAPRFTLKIKVSRLLVCSLVINSCQCCRSHAGHKITSTIYKISNSDLYLLGMVIMYAGVGGDT